MRTFEVTADMRSLLLAKRVASEHLSHAGSKSAATAGAEGGAYAYGRVRDKYLAASEAFHRFSSSVSSVAAISSGDGANDCSSGEAASTTSPTSTGSTARELSGAGVTTSGRRSRPASCKINLSTLIGSASESATGSAESSARIVCSAEKGTPFSTASS